MQQLGYKILNDIAWEKPNPPPNLSCRYFTHSTETVLWAAKSRESRHTFNYDAMRVVTGKQMKTVWRDVVGEDRRLKIEDSEKEKAAHPSSILNPQSSPSSEPSSILHPQSSPGSTPSSILNPPSSLGSVWTMTAPGSDEKTHGKHPTQKPVALVERCLLASTNEGDLVLDPFLGNGTTAVASLRLKRGCVGVELDLHHVEMAARRADREIIEIWLRHFRIRVEISVVGRAGTPLPAAAPNTNDRRARSDAPYLNSPRPQTPDARPENDLDLFPDSINGSRDMADVPEIPTERIFHECKFVFLSCAQVERGAVVHTTVDISLQEAWAKTPTGKKRETTHVVRCETEIFRIKSAT
jgi:DNA modification methylase